MSKSVLPMSSPSEVSQTEKEKWCMTSLLCGILKKKKDTDERAYKTERDSQT